MFWYLEGIITLTCCHPAPHKTSTPSRPWVAGLTLWPSIGNSVNFPPAGKTGLSRHGRLGGGEGGGGGGRVGVVGWMGKQGRIIVEG